MVMLISSSICMTSVEVMGVQWGEKLVRERGAGSGERGAGISSPNYLEF
jgi:hypothetical protein